MEDIVDACLLVYFVSSFVGRNTHRNTCINGLAHASGTKFSFCNPNPSSPYPSLVLLVTLHLPWACPREATMGLV